MVDNDYRLYILVRNDLQSLSSGRAIAQASHATSVFESCFGERSDVKDWKDQTDQAFGTTIVLSASKDKIDKLFSNHYIKRSLVKGWVTDPDYVIRVTHEVAHFMKNVKGISFIPTSSDEKTIAFTRAEKTCAFIFGKKEELSPFIGDWPLY